MIAQFCSATNFLNFGGGESLFFFKNRVCDRFYSRIETTLGFMAEYCQQRQSGVASRRRLTDMYNSLKKTIND